MLAAIPDFRGRQGRSHSLAALLAAIICGLLSGARGCEAIAQWLRQQEPSFWHSLGFKRRPPTKNCYRNILLGLDPKLLESVLVSWAQQLMPAVAGEIRAAALDGKTLCGTMQPHGQSIHLLAVLDQATGGVLGQLRMPSTTNEHKAAMKLLKSLTLEGRLITGDAMFCQREVCQHIVDSGGDYLVTVKDNQPELKETLESEFSSGRSPLHRAASPAAA
jgi:DDE_Tnp_1-associated/Transposase DDE domain